MAITLDELTVRMDALSDEDRASIEALGPGRQPEDYPPELRRTFQALVDGLSAEDRATLQAVLDGAPVGGGDVEGFKMKSTSGDAPHQAPPGMTPPANGGGGAIVSGVWNNFPPFYDGLEPAWSSLRSFL